MGRMVEPNPAILSYLTQVGGRETPVQQRCREETARRDDSVMQISPEQAASLALLARIAGAVCCVEIGVFTGYSALAVALALPPQGRIVALDISRDYTDIARGYWREAGVADRIDLRIGPALASLDAMIAAGEGPFDSPSSMPTRPAMTIITSARSPCSGPAASSRWTICSIRGRWPTPPSRTPRPGRCGRSTPRFTAIRGWTWR